MGLGNSTVDLLKQKSVKIINIILQFHFRVRVVDENV